MEENKQLQEKFTTEIDAIERHGLNCILQRIREEFVDTNVELTEYDDVVMVFSDSNLLPEGVSPDMMMRTFAKLRQAQNIEKLPSGERVLYGLIYNVHHQDGCWRIKVDGDALPMLIDTAKHQTAESIIASRKFSTHAAALLYSEAFRHEDGSFTLTLSELRSRSGARGYATNVYNFDTYVVKAAVNEIRKAFDAGEAELYLTYERLGRGDKAMFTFTIHREHLSVVTTPAPQAQATEDKSRGVGSNDPAQQPQERGVITADPAQPQQLKPATPEAQADLVKQLLELRQEMAKEKEKQKEKDDEREKELKELRQQLAAERAKFSSERYQGFFGRWRLFLNVLFNREDD